jgi:hypothetical protein
MKITDEIAIANRAMALKLRKSLWPPATDVWIPSETKVIETRRFLESAAGRQQIIAASKVNLRSYVENITRLRFQVYGFVIDNKKCLLFDDAVNVSLSALGYPDRWLEESISNLINHPGLFVLYDCDNKRVVAAGGYPVGD